MTYSLLVSSCFPTLDLLSVMSSRSQNSGIEYIVIITDRTNSQNHRTKKLTNNVDKWPILAFGTRWGVETLFLQVPNLCCPVLKPSLKRSRRTYTYYKTQLSFHSPIYWLLTPQLTPFNMKCSPPSFFWMFKLPFLSLKLSSDTLQGNLWPNCFGNYSKLMTIFGGWNVDRPVNREPRSDTLPRYLNCFTLGGDNTPSSSRLQFLALTSTTLVPQKSWGH